ncbi:alpha/beta hydrolase [Mycobacterium sp. Lab-001]|uniref:putative alpha/beta hydrolase n=1 Tax=Mycobacterium sp. Lab-001 TaxID=3410136 RepID=UPI003D172D92
MRLRHISVPALIAEAGGDPWAIDRSLQAGSPAHISGLAEAFHAAGRCTTEADTAFAQARRRFDAAWNHRDSDPPIDASAEVRRVAAVLGAQSLRLPAIGVDLENLAAALAEAQRTAAGQIAALETRLAQLDHLLEEAIELDQGPGLAPSDRSDVGALITACEDDAVDDTRAALVRLRCLRDDYAGRLWQSLSTVRADGYAASPPGTTPEDVRAWWDALGADGGDRSNPAHPGTPGNLDGVPAAMRDAANRAVLRDDLSRVEGVAGRHGISSESLRDAVLHDREHDLLARPGEYGLSAADVTRYRNAVKTNQGVEHDEGPDHDHRRPVLLWAYDPAAFDGKGRAVIAIGDPDTAHNTAVIVPGTDSSVQGGWLYDGHNDAVNLYDQSRKADRTRSTAVLAWMGYDTPDLDPSTLREVGTPGLARRGAALLAADVNGLAVTHAGPVPAHVTVIGHSYGSTTVADAFAGSGMRADDAILIGCPGTDLAHSAADFRLHDGRLYVGAASTDAVSWIGESGSVVPNALNVALGGPLGPSAGLGADPAHDGFGAVRFRAEVAGTHSTVPWFDDHSHYYDVGSEALHNMTEISTGHGDALGREGMLAPARDEQPISIPRQVHTPFGPIPLPHLEIPLPLTGDPEWGRASGSVTDGHGFN